jgi:uncharacterized protein YacL (UPF0231 family)
MIKTVYFNADEIMLRENITIHEINEVHHSFQSFSSEYFAASNNPAKFIQKTHQLSMKQVL